MVNRTINICQPSAGTSCGLCCGSHNYAASLSEIDALFRRRSAVFLFLEKEHGSHDNPDSSASAFIDRYLSELDAIGCVLPKLHEDGIQCPFFAYIDSATDTTGCLLYKNRDSGFPYLEHNTCRHFSCHAFETLTDEEIMFAMKILPGWFYYGLLINNIDLLKSIFHSYQHAGIPDGRSLLSLRESLLNTLHPDLAGAAAYE